MKIRSTVLHKLAELYEASAAGKHGKGKIDIQPEYEELLRDAVCNEGNRYELAEAELIAAAAAGVIALEKIHKHDPRHFSKVRLSPQNERAFYDWIGRESPTARREKWAGLFRGAAAWTVPDAWRDSWQEFCNRRAENSTQWKEMLPFHVTQMNRGETMLRFTALLLSWKGRRLIRYTSYELTGDSKRLERWQRSLEILLEEASGGKISNFESHGLLPMPRVAIFHGPVCFWKNGRISLDASELENPVTLSLEDIQRATKIETTASRCLIIENKAPFLEIAKLNSGTLVVWSSFPNAATVALLIRLHTVHLDLEFFHHGDTDAAGFDILCDLRNRTGIDISSHVMTHAPLSTSTDLTQIEKQRLKRLSEDPAMKPEKDAITALLLSGKSGDFEQERHRPPALTHWPFFG